MAHRRKSGRPSRLDLESRPGSFQARLKNAKVASQSPTLAALMGSLGLAGAAVGQRVKTAAAAPPLAGLVERVGAPEYPEELLLRLDEPAPGLAHFFAMPMGGQIYMPIRIYLYGAEASATMARNEPLWQSWINERFLAVGAVSSDAPSAAEPQM